LLLILHLFRWLWFGARLQVLGRWRLQASRALRRLQVTDLRDGRLVFLDILLLDFGLFVWVLGHGFVWLELKLVYRYLLRELRKRLLPSFFALQGRRRNSGWMISLLLLLLR